MLSKAEPCVVSKVTHRIVPLLFVLYLVAYLDRINVAFGAIQMQRQLHFSDSVYGLGAGIFFIGYLLFQVPSNLMLRRVGARRWICALMLVWGTISLSTGFVSSAKTFYVVRFLLGSTEAGFFPGIILYINGWFPSAVRARTVALFMTAGPLSAVIGGPISGLLLSLHGYAGLAGWQWLFLVEGLPAIFLGIIVLCYLDDAPQRAHWLTDAERTWLTGALSREPRSVNVGSLAPFKSGTVWLLALGLFGITTATSGISLWLPTLIHHVSASSNVTIGILYALPYIAAAIAEFLVALHSDRSGERRWHVAACALAGAIAILAAAYFTSLPAVLAAITIAVLSSYATFGPFWAMATGLLEGNAAAAGIALINSVGNVGGFWGPYVIGLVRTSTGSFQGGLMIASSSLALCGVVVLTIRLAPRISLKVAAQGEAN
jgi:MFS family permease